MLRPLALLAVVSSLAILLPGWAAADTVLIDDTFSGSGNLNNRVTPTGGATWSGLAGTTYSNGTLSLDTSKSQIDYINMGSTYFASNPGIYTLSATYSLPSGTSQGWIGLGFVVPDGTIVPGMSLANSWTNGSSLSGSSVGSEPWLFNRQAGNVRTYAGPDATNQLIDSGTSTAPSGASVTLQLVLNTSLLHWTLDAYVGTTQLDLNGAAAGDTYTYATNPDLIEDIALSTSGTGNFTASVTDLKLTYAAAPEPGTWALLGLGGGLLLLRVRRARTA